MVGQGSPRGDCGANRSRAYRCAGAALLFLVALTAFPLVAGAQGARRGGETPLELRLRIKWGHEASQSWRGSIEVSSGEIAELRHLGPSADGPASYRLRDGRVEVHELSPRSESEVEILVQSFRDANLMLRLEGTAGAASEETLPLAPLIGKQFQLQPSSDSPSLTVRRSPEDVLRITLDNPRNVYAVGESAQIAIAPHEVIPDGAAVTLPLQLRAELRLVRHRAATAPEEVWYERREIESDEFGNLPPISRVEIPLREEGAFEFIIKLENRRFLGGGFSPIEHRQSLIALGGAAPTSSDSPWRGVMEIDPTARSWWDSLKVLPQIKGIPGLSTSTAPLGSAKLSVVSRDGRKWAALPMGAWQAIPLTTQTIGEPHVAQIERPVDQRPRILLLEQHANGNVASVGLDATGFVPSTTDKPGTRLHQLVYWPVTPTAWLVIASGDEESATESRFGAVKLFAGPDQLPAAVHLNRANRGRVLALDIPAERWCELFGGDRSAAAGAAPASYEAALHLTHYLQCKGYNGCRLTVADRGKALYASPFFDHLDQAHGGIDAAELLMRVLSRERLVLLAEFGLNAPLAELEAPREKPEEILPGTDLVLSSGVAARRTMLEPGGAGPIYNPLDSLVRAAIRAPIEDFLDRYAHHDSFAGVVIRLSPDCYTRFPNDDWGKDSPTLVQFEIASQHIKVDPQARPNQRATFSQPDKRDGWLAWRAMELASFYQSIQRLVMDARPEARLYLPLGGLLEGEAAEQRIHKWLASDKTAFQDLWRSAGIEPTSWSEALRETVFLRPALCYDENSSASAARNAAQSSNEWRAFEESFEMSGAAAQSRESRVELSGISARGPFRAPLSESFIQRYSANSDRANPLVDGLLVGDPYAFTFDETTTALDATGPSEWINIFRRLPLTMMAIVPTRAPAEEAKSLPNSPVVIRQATTAGRTWFYAVNPCPFPVTITVDLQAPAGAKLESLGGKKLPALQTIGKVLAWTYTLAPREMVGCAINSPKSKLLSFTSAVDQAQKVELSRELGAINALLQQAQQRAFRPYDVLANPSFETDGVDPASPDFGWKISEGDPSAMTVIANQGASPGACVRLTSRGEVLSLRSEAIPMPTSRRLYFSLALKTERGQRAPQVKLVIEGEEANGRTYVKRATIQKTRPIGDQWQQFDFKQDYLPNLKNLRVGVDVCSAGAVSIDDAELFDFWYDANVTAAAEKEIAIASHSLEKGRVTQAQRVIDGYWSKYLRDQLGRSPQQTARATKESKPPPRDPSIQDRMMDMLPKSIIQRR
jgi:hypothetical protein